jgi:glycosyltransferase involved in cell wall biosynthesis
MSDRTVVDTSVVIPARNAAQTLGEQLDAFAAQRVEIPWEVIVVDNGSDDGTAAVVAAYASRLPVRVVSAGGRLVANHARNVGVGLARGRHILLCDADDVVGPDWVRLMRAVLLDAELVGGALARHHATSGKVPDPAKPAHGFLPRPLGANCGFRRTVWEALGGFDEAYRGGDDAEFFWRAQLAGYRLVYADGAVVSYRLSPTVGAMCRKSYISGRACAQLYRQFRRHGMARSPMARWMRLVLTAPRAVISREPRRAWLRAAAWTAGCVVGSVRYRVFYP